MTVHQNNDKMNKLLIMSAVDRFDLLSFSSSISYQRTDTAIKITTTAQDPVIFVKLDDWIFEPKLDLIFTLMLGSPVDGSVNLSDHETGQPLGQIQLKKGTNRQFLYIKNSIKPKSVAVRIPFSNDDYLLYSISVRPKQLSIYTSEVFENVPFSQMGLNLYSVSNYASFLAPLFDSLQPSHICEIGSGEGKNSAFLATYCQAQQCSYTIVDPVTSVTIEDFPNTDVKVVKKRSVDFLKQSKNIQIFIIDGDHNYQTVFKELSIIDETNQRNQPLCLILHDIGWPCAYRDMYYDLSSLNETPHPNNPRKGCSLYHAELIENGYGSYNDFRFALYEGGEKNGVRKAVADFLDKSSHNWRFLSIPSLYGLGILYDDSTLSNRQKDFLTKLGDTIFSMNSFLSVLEINRVELLQHISDQGQLWARQQKYISQLESTLSEQRLTVSDSSSALSIAKEELLCYRHYTNELEVFIENQKQKIRKYEKRLTFKFSSLLFKFFKRS